MHAVWLMRHAVVQKLVGAACSCAEADFRPCKCFASRAQLLAFHTMQVPQDIFALPENDDSIKWWEVSGTCN
jgi:hypothetical protein